jgi:hypothetical protein
MGYIYQEKTRKLVNKNVLKSLLPLVPLQDVVTSSKKRRAAIVDDIELQETSTENCVDGQDKSDSKIIG